MKLIYSRFNYLIKQDDGYSQDTALLPLMPMYYYCFSIPSPKALVIFHFGI